MTLIKKTRAYELIAANWGPNPPDYIRVLAEACEVAGSQNQVAKRIGYSGAVVSMVLKRNYPGDLVAVEQRIRATLMAEVVDCPAVGQEIDLETCLEHQKHAKARNRSSSFRMTMMRNCPTCPKSRIGGK